MEDKREVQFERAQDFAKKHNFKKAFEISAKTGDNLFNVFETLVEDLYLDTPVLIETKKE